MRIRFEVIGAVFIKATIHEGLHKDCVIVHHRRGISHNLWRSLNSMSNLPDFLVFGTHILPVRSYFIALQWRRMHCVPLKYPCLLIRRSVFNDQKICVYWSEDPCLLIRRSVFIDQKICVYWSEDLCLLIRRSVFTDQKICFYWLEDPCLLIRRSVFTDQKICFYWSEDPCLLIRRSVFADQKNYRNIPKNVNQHNMCLKHNSKIHVWNIHIYKYIHTWYIHIYTYVIILL